MARASRISSTGVEGGRTNQIVLNTNDEEIYMVEYKYNVDIHRLYVISSTHRCMLEGNILPLLRHTENDIEGSQRLGRRKPRLKFPTYKEKIR